MAAQKKEHPVRQNSTCCLSAVTSLIGSSADETCLKLGWGGYGLATLWEITRSDGSKKLVVLKSVLPDKQESLEVERDRLEVSGLEAVTAATVHCILFVYLSTFYPSARF